MSTFDSLDLAPATRTALAAMRIAEPTPIQAQALPLLLAGRDVIGQARTGSGKTLAFGIPLVERARAGRGAAQALVLAPTRELASQVAGVLAHLGRGHRLRVVELVGGRGFGPQADTLRSGAEIVVGTPGRVLDHLKQGTLRLDAVTYFVLDEADEMLDRGFGPDVERIIRAMPASAPGRPSRQSALFSATVPDWAREVAARLLQDPAEVRVDAGRPAAAAPESVDHVVYEVPAGAKPAVLRALLDEEQDTRAGKATLVFGRTRHGVRKMAKQLAREGYRAAALQSDLAQGARDRVIAAFRSGDTPILVATNVAARGLDIPDLARVVNYDLPENGALFTHRVGRTGRMGRAGEAITLLAPEDQPKWRQLEKELKAAGLARPFPRRQWDRPLPELPAAPAPAPGAAAPAPPRSAGRPVPPAPSTSSAPPAPPKRPGQPHQSRQPGQPGQAGQPNRPHQLGQPGQPNQPNRPGPSHPSPQLARPAGPAGGPRPPASYSPHPPRARFGRPRPFRREAPRSVVTGAES